MTLDASLNSYVEFANTLADTSGEILRQYYRALKSVETKPDRTIVTIADKEVEQTIRQLIKKHYPDHGIMGEEFGNENEKSDYQWVIDPIDGTISFSIGRPLFGTLISLVYKNKPVIGIIDQPITKDRWVGVQGEVAVHNNTMIKVRQTQTLEEAILCTTGPNVLRQDLLPAFDALGAKVKTLVYGGDCYNYGLLASGYVDIIIETGLKPHDFCALVPVIESAGGMITDFEGKPYQLSSSGEVLATSSKKLHQLVMDQML